jgi:hypothetical protein
MELILVLVIRHNLFYEKRKMRIAIYNLQRTYLLLRDDFRIGLIISPRVAVLAGGDRATLGLITRPIRKSSGNDIFIN